MGFGFSTVRVENKQTEEKRLAAAIETIGIAQRAVLDDRYRHAAKLNFWRDSPSRMFSFEL